MLPSALPGEPAFDWVAMIDSPGVGGVAVAEEFVVISCRDHADGQDVFLFLDESTGVEVHRVSIPARGELDYGNSSRSTPLLHAGHAYVTSAFGQILCIDLTTLETVWSRDLAGDFETPELTWGLTASPVIAEGKLIVQAGGRKANLVALDPLTGATIWASEPGRPGHSSPVVLSGADLSQIITYDAVSLGGWELHTGRRLWRVAPRRAGDFNVPTPILLPDGVFVTTENNGARRYRFNPNGKLNPEPIAENEDLCPDSQTPVILNGRVYGVSNGLRCLDLEHGLKEIWRLEDEPFYHYVSLIGAGNRLLALTQQGELLLIEDRGTKGEMTSRLPLTSETITALSHPAWANGKLYARLGRQVVRLTLLGED